MIMSHYDDMCAQLRNMGYDIDVSTLEKINRLFYGMPIMFGCFRNIPDFSHLGYQTPQCDERFIR